MPMLSRGFIGLMVSLIDDHVPITGLNLSAATRTTARFAQCAHLKYTGHSYKHESSVAVLSIGKYHSLPAEQIAMSTTVTLDHWVYTMRIITIIIFPYVPVPWPDFQGHCSRRREMAMCIKKFALTGFFLIVEDKQTIVHLPLHPFTRRNVPIQ